MKIHRALIALAIAVMLIGCDSNPKYSPFRSPAYIDIEIEGRKEPLRISSRAEIRSITRTLDTAFIDDAQFRVEGEGRKEELWIWTSYPFPDGRGGTHPVMLFIQPDGRLYYVASMVRQYETTNTAYRDAVLKVADRHLTALKESTDILKKEK